MVSGEDEINKAGSHWDDDPTDELQALVANEELVGSEVDEPTFSLPEEVPDPADASETPAPVGVEPESRAIAIPDLQFEVDQLRSRRSGLEAELEGLHGVVDDLTRQIEQIDTRHTETRKLLDTRDEEIQSLKLQLSKKKQATGAPARMSNPKHDSGNGAARVNHNGDAPALAVLVCLDDALYGRYSIPAGRLRIGSSDDNDVQVMSPFVSRHHAEVISQSGDFVLRDLDSTNGTYVNSSRISRHALRDGDTVTFGKHRFRFAKQKTRSRGCNSGIEKFNSGSQDTEPCASTSRERED